MPGMSATDAYKITPNRYSALISVLGNKKSLDDAFRQHDLKMRTYTQKAMEDERKALTGHGYKMEEISEGKKKQEVNPEDRAQQMAMDWAKSSFIPLDTKEGWQRYQGAYKNFLNQLKGTATGAADLAGGNVNPTGITAKPDQPSRFVNPLTEHDQSVAGQWMKKKKSTKQTPAKSGVTEGTTATNKGTGQKMVFKGGQWQPM